MFGFGDDHRFELRERVREIKTLALGTVYERLWLVTAHENTPLRAAYRVRFDDGRELVRDDAELARGEEGAHV